MSFDIKRFEEFVRETLDEKKIPGASVSIRGDDGTEYHKSFGHIDEGRIKEAQPDTIFGIASMSKSITCLAAAMLECEGAMSFDDPVVKYLPDFKIPGTPRDSVLVRHLADHTTGIPPLPTLAWSMSWHTGDEPWTTELKERYRNESTTKVSTDQDIIDYISQYDAGKILGPPGKYISYSNDSYALLCSAIDKALGYTMETYIKTRIFEPLGMGRSVFEIDEVKKLGNYTDLFSLIDDKLHCSEKWDVAPPYRGCGWIKSTSMDMTLYYLALSNRGKLNGKRALPEAAVERLIGREFPETVQGTYCLGLNKRVFKNAVICEHSGGLTGVSSNGGFIKDKGYAATILTNMGGNDCQPILDAAFNIKLGFDPGYSHNWAIPVEKAYNTSDDLSIYAGEYCSGEFFESDVTLAVTADNFLAVVEDDKEYKLDFCGGAVFTLPQKTKRLWKDTVFRFYAYGGACQMMNVGVRMLRRVK